ncbi:MAG: cytochrome c biogenesis protein ResB [Candidatus Omnitrophica bacterium]|nr:cytochrome c biogenesis protein ResB [Candidatus Omnitrophota bacterium]
MNLVKILGSLYFAVFLIVSLAAILTVSTCLESAYGTPFAQKFFYQAGWFDVFLALFGINIFCSAWLRFPFKKHHIGFILTHAGILTLLIGALLTRLLGIEGQMALYEGERQNHILQEGHTLIIHTSGHETHTVDLGPRLLKTPERFDVSSDGRVEVSVEQILEKASETLEIKEGPAQDPPNRAVQLTLESATVGFNDTVWLVEKNPWDPHSRQLSIGPAFIELKEKEPPKNEAETLAETSPGIHISHKETGQDAWIDLKTIPTDEIAIGQTGFKISNVRYFPDARVNENGLVSVSDNPSNPAVQFEIVDPKGGRERYTRFALFPDFESIHGAQTGISSRFKIEFNPPSSASSTAPSRPSLTFYATDGKWTYESQSSRGKTEGELEAGKTYATGWMDFSFRVEQLIDRAVVSKKIVPTKEKSGRLGVEISASREGRPLGKEWVFEEKPARWETPKGPLMIALSRKVKEVPFVLALKDFRKVDYPGTQNAASFESDVALHDPRENVTIEKTIKMNKPLDYKGYRIFQSSYIQDPGSGEASVFTVAKNPGIVLVYSGACTILTGVILLFYLHPFFSSVSARSVKNDPH